MDHDIDMEGGGQPAPHNVLSVLLAKLTALDELDLKEEDRQKEREKLQRLLRSGARDHTSIQSLSHELIQQIFLLCHAHDSGGDALTSFKPHVAATPLSVSQVCTFWRKVALSTPELWATLAFRGSKDLPYIKQWLKRAGPTQRLAIFYDSYYHGCSFDLTKISHQIECLNLCILDSKRHPKLLLADPRFDSLRELTVTVPSKPFLPIPTDPFVPLGHAPCLRKLTLNLAFTLSRHLKRLHPLFPWSQLTSLSLSKVHWSRFTALLSLCVNIHNGCFEIDIEHSRDLGIMATPDPVAEGAGTLENLQSLGLSLNDFPVPAIFKGLTFGNLQSLSLENTEEIYGHVWTPWIQPDHFFSQLCNLETLIFQHNPFELATLLRHTPKLKNLTICVHCGFESIFRAMTLKVDEPGNNILPNLRRLELKPLAGALTALSVLALTMIQSRLKTTVLPFYLPLEQCTVWIDRLTLGEVEMVNSWVKEVEKMLGPQDTLMFRCCQKGKKV